MLLMYVRYTGALSMCIIAIDLLSLIIIYDFYEVVAK